MRSRAHSRVHPTNRATGPASPRRRQAASRAGYTVVEVVVALILFLIGALGVATTFTGVARLGAEARGILHQSRTMRDVVDSLRLTTCGSLVTGATSSRGIAVAWSATPLARHVQLAVHAAPLSLRTRGIDVELLVPCE